MFAGSKVGQLFVYSPRRASEYLSSIPTIYCPKIHELPDRRGFDLDNLCKQFERKAVLDLTVCEEQDVLFCVSDGQMAAHSLSRFGFPDYSSLH